MATKKQYVVVRLLTQATNKNSGYGVISIPRDTKSEADADALEIRKLYNDSSMSHVEIRVKMIKGKK